MPEFLNNPWVISIVCGLIATAIGFGASRLLDNLHNKRLASRIKNANDFTISQYEVYLVNSSNPSYEILVALRCNAARKYNVSADKLLSVGACIEAVVSGIISNIYLNADQQKNHLANVTTILSMCKKSYTDDHQISIPRTALPASLGTFVTFLCFWYAQSSRLAKYYEPRTLIAYAILSSLVYSVFVFYITYRCSVRLFRREERLYNNTLERQERESNARRRTVTDNHPQEFPQSVTTMPGESDATTAYSPETHPKGE